MSTSTSELDTVRGMQVIALALMVGVILSAGISVFLVHGGAIAKQDLRGLPSIILACLSVLPICFLAAVPALVKIPFELDRPTEEELEAVWRTRRIVSLALCEGSALMNIVAYMIGQNWWSLAIAAGFLFIILLFFPSEANFQNFKEAHLAFRNE